MITSIDLQGTWQFFADEDMQYSRPPEVFADTVQLPGTTATNQKGSYDTERETGCLTELYPYSGNAWFQKEITLPEGWATDQIAMGELFLERTRITKVWINGEYLGTENSLCTPHHYDISSYIGKTLKITVCVNNTDYPTKGGHMTSPDTQTNWNGITGEISVRLWRKNHISRIKAVPDLQKRQVVFDLFTKDNFSRVQVQGEWFDMHGKVMNIIPQMLEVSPLKNDCCQAVLPLSDNAPLWDEYHPVLCRLYFAPDSPYSLDDKTEVCFGLTDFRADGLQFTSHGRPVFLRGKHDGLIFPLTGYAPTTVEEWLKVLQISKSYGINHYRFHTCCPPDAAFTAADLLGMYFEPEIPFWGTLQAPGEDGFNEAEQNYLISEGRKILETFGNHPSFCMFSLGNELWGNPRRMGEIIAGYKKFEKRILFTQGSNNFQHFPNIQPEDDFFVGVRLSHDRLIRGSYGSCDMPYGHVQAERPSTMHHYDNIIFPEALSSADAADVPKEIEIQYGTGVKKVQVSAAADGLIPDKPVITHEIGQYCTYPNFEEIPKYTGVLQARNYEIFRERLEKAGMADLAKDFFTCSGQLAVQCYKEELESAFRSKYISGFQILDIQDFTGQGTATVGILDAFMDSKMLISKKEWRGFCSDSVILGQFPDYVLTDRLHMNVSLRHHSPVPVTEPLQYVVRIGNTIIKEGEIPVNIQGQGLFSLGEISLNLKPASHVHKIKVTLSLPHTENCYWLWQFPAKPMPELESSETLCITSNKTEMLFMLKQGKQVLYFPNHLRKKIEGFYCADFWCYPMFRDISLSMGKTPPVGTLGLNIHKHHQALGEFRCERWSTPPWYEIVTHADCAILDGLKLHPIVQMIDNFDRNHKLGILFECNVGEGKLLVCTSRLAEISDRPETAQFARSLIDYASSEAFFPKETLTFQQIEEIL